MENNKETIIAIVAVMFSAICLLGLVLALVHAHDLENVASTVENVRHETTVETTDATTPDISASDVVTVTERDIKSPSNSGLLDRKGRVAFFRLTDALSQLGLIEVSASASGSSCVITGKVGEDTITLKSKRLSKDDDLDEVFSLSASVYIYEEQRIAALMRDQRVTISKEAFSSTGNSAELSPILLFYDEKINMMISERELDCLNWILVNQIPENIRYVEDVLYCPGNSKNTS